MAYFIGLDLGGTFLKAGVVDDKGRILAKTSVPTGPNEAADTLIQNMAEAARAVTRQAGLSIDQIDYVGIGSPGPIDFEKGILAAAPNLPSLRALPIRDHISNALSRPAILENDANAAALGASWVGIGRDPKIRNLIMLTLGTGVGSGIIVNNHVFHGGRGYGGEAGHMIVAANGRRCNCGQRGCLEAYASASHTAARALEALQASRDDSSLRAVAADNGGRITAKDVCDHAKDGDPLATRILDETAMYLGIACVNLTRLFDPQLVVLGGGLALAGDFLIHRVRAAYREHDWHATESTLQIVAAELGYDTGIVGAAAVAWDAYTADRTDHIPIT